MQARVTLIHALAPLHAGTGQGVGVIDLPIAREKATNLPYLPGSSLKGPLRSACPDHNRKEIFGPDKIDSQADDYASAVQFSDQRLLLLPVRSLAGTFAWVTSPLVLRRFARDAQDAGLDDMPKDIPQPSQTDTATYACVCSGSALVLERHAQIYLEDLDLQPEESAAAAEWARWIGERVFATDPNWQTELYKRFCVVPDDVLNFLLQTATEVVARIRLQQDAKTVANGGLWYEEALPAESVLAGLVLATPNGKKNAAEVFAVVSELLKQPLHLGGKTTVGRGLCRVCMVEGGNHDQNT
ncbi:type III-B CRISPR module RAMP protein Cmr4 [bacterium]|nr:type III-B CRISPR module RAMP protein Cmr4 [bacterium]